MTTTTNVRKINNIQKGRKPDFQSVSTGWRAWVNNGRYGKFLTIVDKHNNKINLKYTAKPDQKPDQSDQQAAVEFNSFEEAWKVGELVSTRAKEVM